MNKEYIIDRYGLKDRKFKSKLTKAQLKQWIKNLRSGDFDQGDYALCTVNEETCTAEYCCLGVLHETLHGEDAWTKSRDAIKYKHKSYDLRAKNGKPGLYGFHLFERPFIDDISFANDEGMTFEEIADYIEEYVEPKE